MTLHKFSKKAHSLLRKNEALNYTILNSMSAHIAVLNHEGFIIAVNESWERFSKENGIQPGQPAPHTQVGSNYLTICQRAKDQKVSDEASNVYLGIQAVLDGSMPAFTVEYPCHSPSEQRWFYLSVTPLGKHGGGVVVAHNNVTEIKLKEKLRTERVAHLKLIADNLMNDSLTQAKNKFESLVAGLNQSAIVAITDIRGKITFANELFADISGYSTEELIGSDHRILNSGHHSSEFFKYMWQTISAGGVWHGEICNRKKDGTLYWVDTTITKLSNQNDESSYMAIRHDITARKIAETKILQSAKLAAIGEMTAGLAHEINNPLAIISGSVELLTKCVDNPEKLEAKVGAIRRSSLRISKIILGLKKFSRSSDKLTLSKRSLSEIAKESLILTSFKASQHNTPVILDEQVTAMINCDEIQIEQVLINLVNNAIDAVHSNLEKWVKVSIIEEGAFVVLRVMDSGKGIPEAVRNKLFQPFYTTKPIGEGTGLGLSITKGILDEHHATITILAECPHTCFELRFPKAE